uniref:Uncharacterized protein n=1 Tax=Glossina pallidipes TaxID=7398 RepID=A0A1B0A8Y2_GLOPL
MYDMKRVCTRELLHFRKVDPSEIRPVLTNTLKPSISDAHVSVWINAVTVTKEIALGALSGGWLLCVLVAVKKTFLYTTQFLTNVERAIITLGSLSPYFLDCNSRYISLLYLQLIEHLSVIATTVDSGEDEKNRTRSVLLHLWISNL